jgi:hypothetical protein
VRAGIGEAVAVRGATTEEPSLGGLGAHGAADTDLDPATFALGHAPEERHHHLLGVALEVDLAAEFGDPQAALEVGEHRVGELVLDPRERSGGLADHDGIETSIGSGEIPEQPSGLGTALPWQGPRGTDVEVLGHDRPADRFDDLAGPRQLPVP